MRRPGGRQRGGLDQGRGWRERRGLEDIRKLGYPWNPHQLAVDFHTLPTTTSHHLIMSHPITGPAAEETYPEIWSWVYSVSREREVELLRQEVRNPL